MNAVRFVFIDGQFSEEKSDLMHLPQEAKWTYSERARLELQRNFKMECPIHFQFLNGRNSPALHIDIFAEEGAEAVMIEEHVEHLQGTSYTTNMHIQFHLQPYAKLRYYKLQSESLRAIHQASIKVEQKKGSAIELFFADCGAELARSEMQIRLLERDAACHIKGLYYLLHKGQALNIHMQVDHAALSGTSSMLFKGVLDGQSKAAVYSKVHVHANALHTKTEQANHNLLLSDYAEVKTEPHLQIDVDEVQCKHGATVGQFDPAALFYLRSRGIQHAEAMQLLTQAFIAEVIEAIPDESVRAMIYNRGPLSHAQC